MSAMLSIQYALLNQHGHMVAVSTLFTAMVIYELLHLLDIRSQYKLGWLSNKWLIISIGFSLTLQLIVLYVPAIAKYFEAVPIGLNQWIVIGIGAVILSIIMRVLGKAQKSGAMHIA
jgi:P-type Ca2+ transporter type 2C